MPNEVVLPVGGRYRPRHGSQRMVEKCKAKSKRTVRFISLSPPPPPRQWLPPPRR
jgi:hypothetical protein